MIVSGEMRERVQVYTPEIRRREALTTLTNLYLVTQFEPAAHESAFRERVARSAK